MRMTKGEGGKGRVEEQYKKKMSSLEGQLKEMREKEKTQMSLAKTSSQQSTKIRTLCGEIDRMKTQKVSMMRKMKEEADKHREWKAARAKEILQLKKISSRKDRQITKLQRENKRKENLAKRKQEELAILQRRQRAERTKRKDAQDQRGAGLTFSAETVRDWIVKNTEKLLRDAEITEATQLQENSKREVEAELTEEWNLYGSLTHKKETMQRDREMTAEDDLERIYELEDKLREVECDMAAVNGNIESLEEKNDFINNRIAELHKEKLEVNAEDIEVLRFTDIRTVEHAKICLSTFFGLLLDLNVYKKQLEKKAVEQETTIETLRVEIASLSADRDSREA